MIDQEISMSLFDNQQKKFFAFNILVQLYEKIFFDKEIVSPVVLSTIETLWNVIG